MDASSCSGVGDRVNDCAVKNAASRRMAAASITDRNSACSLSTAASLCLLFTSNCFDSATNCLCISEDSLISYKFIGGVVVLENRWVQCLLLIRHLHFSYLYGMLEINDLQFIVKAIWLYFFFRCN